MQQLGFTRSAYRRDYLLQTPDTFVRAALPGMQNATAIVHTAPANGARFTQYTVEFASNGVVQPQMVQRFVYVLEGEVEIQVNGCRQILSRDGYVFFPSGSAGEIRSHTEARAAVIEKSYISEEGVEEPVAFTRNERDVKPEPLAGCESTQVRALIPPDFGFDFAVSTLTFAPGASLPMVEIHCMEHGLLMLDGGGIYRLGEEWYPTTAGDFIWMAPYCPQWFGCIGSSPTRYLIYKDWNRHPMSSTSGEFR